MYIPLFNIHNKRPLFKQECSVFLFFFNSKGGTYMLTKIARISCVCV